MQKILGSVALAGALFVANANAADDTRWYAGVEVGSGSTKVEQTNSYSGSVDSYYINDREIYNNSESYSHSDFKLNVGKGTGNLWFVQGYYISANFNKVLFENKKMTEFGVEFMKQFAVSEQLYPFIKIGIGLASTDTPEGYSESSIKATSFTLGAGVDFKANENVSIMVGLDFNGKSWQDIEYEYAGNYDGVALYGTETVEVTSATTRFYVGANYRF